MADEETNNNPDETSASTPTSNSGTAGNTKASKDRSCPFCGQAFTSSSLGRHLDLYIKPKNPKPPDGVHDIDEIRKLRGGITRRQPRTSLKASLDNGRNGSLDPQGDNTNGTPSRAGTARPSAYDGRLTDDTPLASPVNADRNDHAHTFLNQANWQATGVINNLPPRAPSRNNERPGTGQAQRVHKMRRDAGGHRIQRPEHESESMWKLQEAAELGRAAEMALREVLGSLEAAQKKVEPKAIFDDFDFYSLSFPGLCLAILPPPGTLFSPTPFPSAESWTLGPPGLRQFEAMNRFLNERIAAKRKNIHIPDSVAFKHHSHLSGAWEHWQSMTDTDRTSAWTLEILRSFTRASDQTRQLRSQLEQAQHHTRHLEAEYERLSQCQLPREYLMHPPNTLPVPQNVLREMNTSTFRSGVAETNYDAGELLSKWRTTIRQTTRPLKTSQQQPQQGTASSSSIYDEPDRNQLRDDMIMQGSVWNVNGPVPRQREFHTETARKQLDAVSYQTPPQPGAVVGADDEDGGSNADADAEGEAEDEPSYSTQNALTRRFDGPVDDKVDPLQNGGIAGILNANGKRPLATASSGRGATKVYKEHFRDADIG
ncbi:hypothetical protein CLAFUW4_01308 [Fulvia fulva]|uniref:Uncharacterized protein n=1 Tax=Passalora fulva TaxID=5499 RepID=A0A9Q8P3A6_PASFU|nr:uncharacterized protein CLAFUR5_01313 [Fulvia fulva]KAK4634260.1 hypothetical protein CLAFUR4_01309 [Fulvia fulva]KAK4636960.1 hypothetical protein CLAFUR0_01310 [Fulvia fulva]UJO11820.1 hypothetical protein CLAFUR5_01313 [Fulvia fulva]WPV10155.1 hypothetical protein CLAFUW4_01308 [Fulvia fulva]WPV24223.1 hypothetical protein CLAFUW7_01313 [Fulvia fulva]